MTRATEEARLLEASERQEIQIYEMQTYIKTAFPKNMENRRPYLSGKYAAKYIIPNPFRVVCSRSNYTEIDRDDGST
jgi:hypothetical protein